MPDEYADLIRGVVGTKPKGTYDPDTALDLIAQHESGGRNIKQQIVPAGGGYNPSVGRVTGPSTAGGPWQITNTTWNRRAPREIAQKYPTAMSAPVEVQREVARKIFNETGFQDWAPYNASLRKAIAQGDQPKTQQPRTRPVSQPDDEYSKLIKEAIQQPESAGRDLVVAPGRGKQSPMVVRRQAAEAANPQVSSFDPAQSSNTNDEYSNLIREAQTEPKGSWASNLYNQKPAQPQSPHAGVRGGITRPQSQPATGLVPGMGGISRMRTRPKPVPSSDRMAGARVSGTSRSNVEALMSSPQANPFGAAPDPERDAANNAEAQKRYSQLLTANAAEVARVKDEARKEIQNQGGWTPETDKWLAETFSRGESHFNELLAGGVRPFSARKFNQLWSRAEGIRQAVEEESQGRSATSKWAQGTLAGLTSPEMAAAALHVPPEIAFGGGAGLSSLGRGESPTQAANATRQGAVEGALFRGPAIGKNVVIRALTKGGTVGAGTYALTGDPAAAASNAVFAASGPILHGEGAPERTRPQVEPQIEYRESATPNFDEGLAPRLKLNTNRDVAKVPDVTEPAVTQERPNAPLIKPATIEEPQITPPPAEAVGKESPATAPTPETKPSRLAQGVEAKAVAAKLTEGFADLPEYKTIKVADQAQKATELLNSDPELAKRIATGQEMPKGDLLPESVFTAVENRALANGDVQTIEDLARGSRSVEASGLGQRIRMLGERNPHSPVKAIADIEKARSAGVPKEKVTQTINKIKTEVSVELKKSYPKGKEWSTFLDSIMCK